MCPNFNTLIHCILVLFIMYSTNSSYEGPLPFFRTNSLLELLVPGPISNFGKGRTLSVVVPYLMLFSLLDFKLNHELISGIYIYPVSEMQPHMYLNIVLTGGNAMLPGFRDRL